MEPEKKVMLAHGSGGSFMHSLIRELFLKHLGNAVLNELSDSAVLGSLPAGREICFTTDSYVVNPLFFPGGDIGKLAVCGTVNDLAVSGAEPFALACGFILEEGLEYAVLEKVVRSIKKAAGDAGIRVCAGDTKVVEKGKVDGIFINTSGLGFKKKSLKLGRDRITPGDRIIINGTIGDHEFAVVAARGEFQLKSGIVSDCSALHGLVARILAASDRVRFMRDPTRGGLATTLNEIVAGRNYGIILQEKAIPIRENVRAFCEILGFDPLYCANEGKVVVIAGARDAERIVSAMKKHPLGRKSRIIGEVTGDPAGKVILETVLGSRRVLEMPSGSQFPRIC